MYSDQCNSTVVKYVGLIFSLFDIASAQEVSFGIPQCINVFFMDLPVASFVFYPSLLTAKSVDSVVVHDGFFFL